MALEFHKQPVLMFDIYTAIVLVYLFESDAVGFVYLDEAVASCIHIAFVCTSYMSSKVKIH